MNGSTGAAKPNHSEPANNGFVPGGVETPEPLTIAEVVVTLDDEEQ